MMEREEVKRAYIVEHRRTNEFSFVAIALIIVVTLKHLCLTE
jgi:hypothetical protein